MMNTPDQHSTPTTATGSRRALASDEFWILFALALIKLLLHVVANATDTYGYFRDELYYLACTEHPDLGYVDQPPLSIYILSVSRFLFGDSLFAIRLLPALAGSVTVFFTGLIVRELGGGRFAILLAGISLIVSLVIVGMHSVYSMNAFDILIWTIALYLLLRLTVAGTPRLWLLLGVMLGIGLLNKIGVLWLGFGIAVALIATPARQWLKTPWPWAAAAIALLLFLPYIIWNLQNDLAHLEFIRRATAGKYSGLSRMDFILGQILTQNPVTFPVWIAGLWFLLFSDQRGRILGIVFLSAFAILLINSHSKPEYLAAAYAPLFAGGGIIFERWFLHRPWRIFRIPLLIVVASGLFFVPMVLPVLSVRTYLAYQDMLGVSPGTSENLELAELPQFYADRFGWEEKARAVADVFNSLSPEDQQICAVFADNYGRCGALDFFGRKLGLPGAIGRHNSYWIWGPGKATGELMIILGGELEHHQEAFETVTIAGTVSSRYCMPYENNLRIYVCRRPTVPLSDLWPQLKHYM